MKITKRPKKTKITYIKVIRELEIIKYNCPTCKTTFKMDFPMRKVTRFICDCGQELIVD